MMTLAEFGLYNWLLDYAWHNDSKPCFLENDAKKLCRLVGQPLSSYLKSWVGVQKHFELWIDPRTQVEYFYSPWLYEEYSKQLAFSERQSVKGKIRAAERWKDHKKTDSRKDSRIVATAIAEPVAGDENAAIKAATNEKEEEKVSPTPLSKRTRKTNMANASPYTPEFEEFWKVSSKRGSKFEAFELWQQFDLATISGTVQAAMIAAIRGEWADCIPKHIPHVRRWLHGRNWETFTSPDPAGPSTFKAVV